MNRSGKLHALLSTARVANVPSVVSNVWLGVAVGMIFCDFGILEIPWELTARLAAAGISLYVAGNFFNDWMDRDWDAKHRPERGLPRGLFSPSLYICLAAALGTTGVGLAATVNGTCASIAGIIVGCIWIYTVWHKRSPWAVIPMGLCRALLPLLGFAGTGAGFFEFPQPIMIATSLLCYIAGLSLSARYESMAAPPQGAALAARGLFGLTAILMFGAINPLTRSASFCFAGLAPYGIWLGICLTIRRKPVSAHVSALLAGIPLVDWIVLLPIGLGLNSEPFAIACLATPPLAFISALLLQRLAPAT